MSYSIIPDPGMSVSGRITNSLGEPVANVSVALAELTTTTAADGTFSFETVPVDEPELSVEATTYFGAEAMYGSSPAFATERYTDINVGDIMLHANVINAISPVYEVEQVAEGVTTLPYELWSDSHVWVMTADASIDDGLDNLYAYDHAQRLVVNGVPYGGGTEAALLLNGRMVSYEAERIGDVDVSRKVYVPEVGGFARNLEVVSNPTDTEQTVAIKVFGNLGADGEATVAATSSGDQVVAANDSYFVVDDACSTCGVDAVAHIISGELAPQVASDVTLLSDDYAFTYDLVIPPGERRIVMHYSVQRRNVDEATDLAGQLHALSYPVEGLTKQELHDIVNFKYLVDSDRDGVFDVDEFMLGMDLASNDSDGDLLTDLFEYQYGLNPLSLFGEGEAAVDTDLDGLTNLEEQDNNTDPTLPDTDGDGLTDSDEVNTHLTNPVLADTDRDGWSDYEEITTYGSDPLVADVDANLDGIPDSGELVPVDVSGPDFLLFPPFEGSILQEGIPVLFIVSLFDESQVVSATGRFNTGESLFFDSRSRLTGEIVPRYIVDLFSQASLPLLLTVTATDGVGNESLRRYSFEVVQAIAPLP
jgi:hypothetical protein